MKIEILTVLDFKSFSPPQTSCYEYRGSVHDCIAILFDITF